MTDESPVEEDYLESRYVCKECSHRFEVGESARFCAQCGTRVTRVGKSEMVDTRRRLSVMLVDDSAVARHKVAAILRSLECDVVEMTGGQAALDKLDTSLPDLLILDINMPHVTGLHVLEQVRSDKRHAKMHVVMLTGEADGKVVARAIALKAADYIRKDDPVGSIKDRLSEHLKKLDRS